MSYSVTESVCGASQVTKHVGASVMKLEPQEGIAHLEYEATHPRAGGQHEEDVGEEHEVALALLLADRKQSSASSKELIADIWQEQRSLSVLPFIQ